MSTNLDITDDEIYDSLDRGELHDGFLAIVSRPKAKADDSATELPWPRISNMIMSHQPRSPPSRSATPLRLPQITIQHLPLSQPALNIDSTSLSIPDAVQTAPTLNINPINPPNLDAILTIPLDDYITDIHLLKITTCTTTPLMINISTNKITSNIGLNMKLTTPASTPLKTISNIKNLTISMTLTNRREIMIMRNLCIHYFIIFFYFLGYHYLNHPRISA
jgi:hypothetical protein